MAIGCQDTHHKERGRSRSRSRSCRSRCGGVRRAFYRLMALYCGRLLLRSRRCRRKYHNVVCRFRCIVCSYRLRRQQCNVYHYHSRRCRSCPLASAFRAQKPIWHSLPLDCRNHCGARLEPRAASIAYRNVTGLLDVNSNARNRYSDSKSNDEESSKPPVSCNFSVF